MQDRDDGPSWWANRDGQQIGPISQDALAKLVEAGHLRSHDHVWRAGLDAWCTVAEATPLAPELAIMTSVPQVALEQAPAVADPTSTGVVSTDTSTPPAADATSEPVTATPVVALVEPSNSAPGSAAKTSPTLTTALAAAARPVAAFSVLEPVATVGAVERVTPSLAPTISAAASAAVTAAPPTTATRSPPAPDCGLTSTARALESLSRQAATDDRAGRPKSHELTRVPAVDPAPTVPSRRGGALVYGLMVLITIGLSLASCMQFMGEGNATAQIFAAKGVDRGNAVHLDLQIVEANLVREQMRVHAVPTLTGSFAAGSPRLPAREIELTVATLAGPRVIVLKRDHHIEPFDFDIALSDGDILVYPMDRYAAQIEAEALILAGNGQPAEKVPLVITFASRNHAVHVEARAGAAEASNVVISLEIGRLLPIVVFTWFMAGVASVIALAVVLMVTMVFSGRREPDLGMLAWSAALLFALPAVRNNLPGAPPLGALVDYTAFFWAEALVGLSMLVLLYLWVTHQPTTPAR